MDSERLAEIKGKISLYWSQWHASEDCALDTQAMRFHIDAQAERILALEAAVTSDSAGYVKDCAAIRQETATAIAREIADHREGISTVSLAPDTARQPGDIHRLRGQAEAYMRAEAICRKHGATP